jgi:Surface-adhesin protein E
MFKNIFLPAIILLFVIAPVKAEWVMMDAGPDQNDVHYYDPASIKNNGRFKKVWILTSYGEEQTGGYRSVKSFYELDCKEDRARSYTMLLYTDEMATGDVIGAQHDKLKEWSVYPADSIFSQIADAVCASPTS